MSRKHHLPTLFLLLLCCDGCGPRRWSETPTQSAIGAEIKSVAGRADSARKRYREALQSKRYAEAVSAATDVIELSERHLELYVAYKKQGGKPAFRVQPTYPALVWSGYRDRGVANHLAEKWREASEDLGKYLEWLTGTSAEYRRKSSVRANLAHALWLQGDCYHKLGRNAEAGKTFSMLQQLRRDNALDRYIRKIPAEFRVRKKSVGPSPPG